MSTHHKLLFEDLEVDRRYDLGSVSLSKEAVIDFARQYDPQEFHLDEAAANAVFGGLAASGWQTVCLYQRALVDGFLGKTVCVGGAGVENVQFFRPFFAGTSLSASVVVAEKHLSKSKPDRGRIKLQCEMKNSEGDLVFSMCGVVFIATKEAAS